MIGPNPSNRISIEGVTNHPLFQSPKILYTFIAEICNRVDTKKFSLNFLSRLEWNLGKFDWRRHQGHKVAPRVAKKSIIDILKSISQSWDETGPELDICPHLFINLYRLVTLEFAKDSDWFTNWYGAENAAIIAKNFWSKRELGLVVSQSRYLQGHSGDSDIRYASWCPNSNILATTGSDGAIIFWRLWAKQVN